MHKKVLAVSISAVLAGCGGGESGTTSNIALSPAATLSIQSQIEPSLFSEGTTKFPDIRTYFSGMCGNQTNIQNFFLADVNKDGRKDVVMNLWCRSETGLLTYGPVKNRLLIFTQQNNGSFVESTKAILGKEYVDIGGVGINHVVYDFNKDGYDDFVFIVNREDARLPSPDAAVNHNSYNMFFTSKGDGTYDVSPLGSYAWHYGAKLIDNKNGSKDIITLPIGYNALPEHWSYENGKWISRDSYKWISGTDPVIFSGNSTHAMTSLPHPDLGVALYSKTSTGAWIQTDAEKFGDYKMVPWYSWQHARGLIPLYTIDGKQYISIATANMCEIKTPHDSTAIVAVSGNEFITPYVEGTTVEEGASYLKLVSKLLAYKNTGQLDKDKKFIIHGENTAASIYRMNCVDVNNDGYDDITMHDWRAKTEPMIYVNNKDGTMSRVNPEKIPGKGLFASSQSYIYQDVNNDGIRDIIYWPIAGVGDQDDLALKVFYGNRQIKDSDLIKN